MQKNTLLLGAHLSGAGGLHKAIEIAQSLDCNTLQLFTKNNRQWKAKKLTAEEINLFKEGVKNSRISPNHIFAHATYLINIGSPNPEVEKKSIEALKDELDRCHLLGIDYLILHPGSHVGTTELSCLERITHNLNTILKNNTNTVTILLETMAGQGSVVGYTFEQLAFIIKRLPDQAHRLGVCLDTCHIFTAGYDFTHPTSYRYMWEQFDTIIGFNFLKLIHLNDSKTALNSHVDRHQDIGKGMIGLEAFALLIHDQKLHNIPKILETPYNTLEDHTRNLNTVRSL